MLYIFGLILKVSGGDMFLLEMKKPTISGQKFQFIREKRTLRFFKFTPVSLNGLEDVWSSFKFCISISEIADLQYLVLKRNWITGPKHGNRMYRRLSWKYCLKALIFAMMTSNISRCSLKDENRCLSRVITVDSC